MDAKTKEEQRRYGELVKEHRKSPPIFKRILLAFLIGGILCLLGQGILNFFSGVERTTAEASATALAAMILLGAVLTGLGLYDELGQIGGAGAAIPITGFANTIVSAAMEFKREGLLLGMGAKMFVIAGPVLVYGILASFFVALLKSALTGEFQ